MKIFIVRKYVIADTIEEAIKLESNTPVHDCWVEDTSLKNSIEQLGKLDPKDRIGFCI